MKDSLVRPLPPFDMLLSSSHEGLRKTATNRKPVPDDSLRRGNNAYEFLPRIEKSGMSSMTRSPRVYDEE